MHHDIDHLPERRLDPPPEPRSRAILSPEDAVSDALERLVLVRSLSLGEPVVEARLGNEFGTLVAYDEEIREIAPASYAAGDKALIAALQLLIPHRANDAAQRAYERVYNRLVDTGRIEA
jgi:hypothetical protein